MLYVNIVSADELRDQMRDYGKDYYTYEGYEEIVRFYEEYPDDVELDPEMIVQEWWEDDYTDIAKDFDDLFEKACWNYTADDVLETLSERTYAVRLDGDRILYQIF